jgi:hypothetical protein
LPRTKLTEKYCKPKTDEPTKTAPDERLSTLPPEVREALASMSDEDRDNYLQSLDKTDAMIKSGETFTPDVPAPYGFRKDGQPKDKPGRRPAANAGQRTAAKMARDGIGQSLEEFVVQHAEQLEDHPEDDPDVPVKFGYETYAGQIDENGNPIIRPDGAPTPTAAERAEAERAAERAEQEAALAEALARHSLSNVTGPFPAVRLISQGDPDDLANYTVDRRDCELRLRDVGKAYRLEMRYLPDGPWETVGDAYHPDGSVAALARMQVKPLDSDAFGLALNALPKPHPAVTHLYDRGPRELRPMTADEQRKHNEEIKRKMIEQRQANALHRGNYTDHADRTGEGYSWI